MESINRAGDRITGNCAAAPSPDLGLGSPQRTRLVKFCRCLHRGSIGTGLFVASGATVAQAGPGGALLAYAIIGLMVYFLMTSLGELAAFMPVSGPSPPMAPTLSIRPRLRPALELLV